jgi:hypothetical protein
MTDSAEREAFQKYWRMRHGWVPTATSTGDFVAPTVQDAWESWQARASTPPAPPAPKVVPLSEERIVRLMNDSGWPPSMLAPIIKAKLIGFARALEAALSAAPSDPKDDVHQT